MDRYQILMAKTDRETGGAWLPLWMHLRDTAGIMKKLTLKWLPRSVFSAAGLEEEEFLKAAVFLAAVHDIGKATSYFQSIITKACPEKYDEITGSGFIVNKEYRERGKTPHAHAGQCILQNDMSGLGIPESMAVVVGAHHGEPYSRECLLGDIDLIGRYPVNFFGTERDENVKNLWKDSWRNIMDQAMSLADIQTADSIPILTEEAQVLLSGLLIVADWIASNPSYLPLLPLDVYGDEGMYPGRIDKGWAQVGFPDSWYPDINTMDEEAFRERFGFLPNEVQKCMMDVIDGCTTPGIFILEAQMGVGKTEAALAAAEVLAHRKQEGGIFFGLPTQATSNGVFERLCEWGRQVFEETENAVRLAHGSAELNEDYQRLIMKGRSSIDDEGEQDGLSVHPWFQGSKRALLADLVIGTVDQFLMASLRRRHFMLRHLGLAGKVVVIDECHAYDAYMNVYLERSLQWMAAYGVPVILLSATLPVDRRRSLVESYVKAYSRYRLGKRKPKLMHRRSGWEKTIDYPLLTWTDGETVDQECIRQSIKNKNVRILRVNAIADMLCLLDERLQEGGCACIIANTVRYAQEIYTECRKRLKDVELILYHAQFTMPHRARKEKELMKKMGRSSEPGDRDRSILIGTQVLEQSLDYDADIMVTQICPMDLFLQRIGRLHRHERVRPKRLTDPECVILQEEDGSYDAETRAVYGDYLLIRTERVLDKEIRIPGDIPLMIQEVYDRENSLGLTDEAYKTAVEAYEKKLTTKEEKAKDYLLKKPSKKGIGDILDDPETSSEKIAEASVRDAASSIEVLLMKEGLDGEILSVDGTLGRDPAFSKTRVPTNEEGRMVAKQRLRLPHIFSCSWDKRDVIGELEEQNRKELAEWQQSPWIRGELVLLLDENSQAELNGYSVSYSFEKGLEYERKGI